MSKKDFDEYYIKITKQYDEMKDSLNEFAELCQNGIVEPERYEAFIQTLTPVKESWMTLTYVKYLLDLPVNKSKIPRYASQSKKLLSQVDSKFTSEGIERSNAETLVQLHKSAGGLDE